MRHLSHSNVKYLECGYIAIVSVIGPPERVVLSRL